jgi:hypothetical protein
MGDPAIMRTFTAIFAAALLCATAAEALTVKEKIHAAISSAARNAYDRRIIPLLPPLMWDAYAYVENNGFADLEAMGSSGVHMMGKGVKLTLSFWSGPNRIFSRTNVKILTCIHEFEVTTCEVYQ